MSIVIRKENILNKVWESTQHNVPPPLKKDLNETFVGIHQNNGQQTFTPTDKLTDHQWCFWVSEWLLFNANSAIFQLLKIDTTHRYRLKIVSQNKYNDNHNFRWQQISKLLLFFFFKRLYRKQPAKINNIWNVIKVNYFFKLCPFFNLTY